MTRSTWLTSSVEVIAIGGAFWCAVWLWNGWAYHVCGQKYAYQYERDPYATRVADTYYPGCGPTFRVQIPSTSQLLLTVIIALAFPSRHFWRWLANGSSAPAVPSSEFVVGPTQRADGSVCTHDGETSNYCTQCWVPLKPGVAAADSG